MTIKVITKGIDPKTIPLRGTCHNCSTVVECEQSDAKYHVAVDQRDDSYFSVTCPTCNHSISLIKAGNTNMWNYR